MVEGWRSPSPRVGTGPVGVRSGTRTSFTSCPLRYPDRQTTTYLRSDVHCSWEGEWRSFWKTRSKNIQDTSLRNQGS